MLVSVVIPTYNRISYLPNAIDSAISQKYKNKEIIIIDDGSTDGTAQYVRSNYPEIRLLVLKKNNGASFARNKGIDISNGEFIAFLDSDDIWSVDYLNLQIAAFLKFPNVEAVFCSHIKIDQYDRKIIVKQTWPIENPRLQLILGKNFIHTMSLFMARKSAIINTGPLNCNLEICHDREFYIRMLETSSFYYNEDILVARRYSDNQVTNKLFKWYKEAKKILDVFIPECVDTDHNRKLKENAYIDLVNVFQIRARERNALVLKLYFSFLKSIRKNKMFKNYLSSVYF